MDAAEEGRMPGDTGATVARAQGGLSSCACMHASRASPCMLPVACMGTLHVCVAWQCGSTCIIATAEK